MQTMYFRDGKYHRGINLTIRHGKHWFSRLKTGDRVTFWITGTKTENRPIMNIVSSWYGAFNLLYMFNNIEKYHHANYNHLKIRDELEKIKPNCTKNNVSMIFFTVSDI